MKRVTTVLSGVASVFLGAACLVGCAPEHGAAAIPPTAQTLASSHGGMVSATPAAAGTVYVFDATANRLIYSGLVNAGDHVVVDPGSNVVTVNSVTVTEHPMFGDHEYDIKFSQ